MINFILYSLICVVIGFSGVIDQDSKQIIDPLDLISAIEIEDSASDDITDIDPHDLSHSDFFEITPAKLEKSNQTSYLVIYIHNIAYVQHSRAPPAIS